MKRSSPAHFAALLTLLLGLFSFTSLLLGCRPFTQSAERRIAKESATSVAVSKSEELAVYSAVIEQMFPESRGKRVVISDQTIDCPPYEREADWQQGMLDKMPDVRADTYGDYLAKTKQCYSLTLISDLGSKFTIIPDHEVMDVIRQREAGWAGFYLRYPDAPGFISLGRIGFNPEVNQALVHASLYYGVNGYKGAMAMLSKKDGAWEVERKYQPFKWTLW